MNAEDKPQATAKRDADGGITIDLVYGQFVDRRNRDAANGLTPSLKGRFGANGALGLNR